VPVDPVGAAPAESPVVRGPARAIDDDEPVPGAITRRKSGTAPTSCHGLSPDRKQISHCRRCPPGDHLLIEKSLAHRSLGVRGQTGGGCGLVPALGDGLEPRGNRAGRLDLNDEVDQGHVDSQLQRARCHKPLAAGRSSSLPRSTFVAPWKPSHGGRAPAPHRELVKRPQSRSARRRELTNTIVLLCSEMSSTK